jgi:hypothetical protein
MASAEVSQECSGEGWQCGSVVECSCSLNEALGSILDNAKKEKEKKQCSRIFCQ